MAKIVKYENDAKQKILEGINKLEKATSVTLGPAGRNVIIDQYGTIHSTKDGVTVAKSITLKDPFENLGANALKEIAEKNNKNCGDGTTTSTLLGAEIYRHGLKHVALGSNATSIKNGIKKAAEQAINYVKTMSKPISTKEDIKRVCTVSANGDEKIGEMIASVMDKIGKDGTIKVEDSQTMEMTSKVVEGMVLDVGYVSPYMITKQETMEADLNEPFILLANKKVTNIQEVLPCLQSVSQSGHPLVIIGDEFQDDIIGTVIMNRLRPGGLNCVLVKSPSYGENRKSILEDIAITTGGRVVSDDLGTKLEAAVVGGTILGSAKRILVTKDSTVIFGGAGDAEQISARAESLRQQISNTTSEYDKEKLQERLAKLASGIGVIQVGADTEAERKELRDRVDDAFCAAKCAVKSGIVPGGGIALLKAGKDIRVDANNIDEANGVQILVESLRAPIAKILSNSGLNAEKIISVIESNDSPNYGYNVIDGTYVDMVDAGIIDATDVVVNEIRNAASIASLLLTTEALIVEEPVDKTNSNSAQPMMPPMM